MVEDSSRAASLFTEGGTAVAEGSIVLLDGPDGIAISMTADAAEQTGRSLLAAACLARKQETPDT